MCVCVCVFLYNIFYMAAGDAEADTWMRLAPGAMAYGRHGKVGLQCVPHVASTHTHTMQRQQAAYKRHPGEVGSGAAEGLKLWMKLELQLQQLANAARTHSHTHTHRETHAHTRKHSQYHHTHTQTKSIFDADLRAAVALNENATISPSWQCHTKGSQLHKR